MSSDWVWLLASSFGFTLLGCCDSFLWLIPRSVNTVGSVRIAIVLCCSLHHFIRFVVGLL